MSNEIKDNDLENLLMGKIVHDEDKNVLSDKNIKRKLSLDQKQEIILVNMKKCFLIIVEFTQCGIRKNIFN